MFKHLSSSREPQLNNKKIVTQETAAPELLLLTTKFATSFTDSFVDSICGMLWKDCSPLNVAATNSMLSIDVRMFAEASTKVVI